MTDNSQRGLTPSLVAVEDSPYCPVKMTIFNTPEYLDAVMGLYASLDKVKIHHADLDNLVVLLRRTVLNDAESYHITINSNFDEQTVQLPNPSTNPVGYRFTYINKEEEISHYDSSELDVYDIILDGEESLITRFIAAQYASREYDTTGSVETYVPIEKFSELVKIMKEAPFGSDISKLEWGIVEVSMFEGVSLHF